MAIALLTTASLRANAQTDSARTVRDASLVSIGRQIAAMKQRVGAIRTALDSAPPMTSRERAWISVCCPERLADLRASLARVRDAVLRSRVAYSRDHNERGLKVTEQLGSHLARVAESLDSLETTADPKSARIAVTHLSAGLEALLQTIDERDRCCGDDEQLEEDKR